MSVLSSSKNKNTALSEEKHHVYILVCKDRSYHTGCANEPIDRFVRHCKGHGANYTKRHKPLKIVWKQSFKTEKEAKKREKQIKG